jgi:PKD repeat protein
MLLALVAVLLAPVGMPDGPTMVASAQEADGAGEQAAPPEPATGDPALEPEGDRGPRGRRARRQADHASRSNRESGTDAVRAAANEANEPPAVVAPADQIADEGRAKSFVLGSFADSRGDGPWAVEIDWGDGSARSTLRREETGRLRAPHKYADDGAYDVAVTVTDRDGAAGAARFVVAVANVAPGVPAPTDADTTEGISRSFMLGPFRDPGARDGPWVVEVDWGDGAKDTWSRNDRSRFRTMHKYADDGVYRATVAVADKDGGTGSASFSVTVSNAPPWVSTPPDQIAHAGLFSSLRLGVLRDMGPDDPWTVDVNWGDGSKHTTFSRAATGTLPNESHHYLLIGTYRVTVTVTDADGASSKGSFQVTVRGSNPLPRLVATFDQTASAGVSTPISLGELRVDWDNGPYTVDVDWGDGSEPTFLHGVLAGDRPVAAHVYDRPGTYRVHATATDADGARGYTIPFVVSVS